MSRLSKHVLLLAVASLTAVALLATGCTSQTGPQGPQGPPGPPGPPGKDGATPSEKDLLALMEKVVAGPAAKAESVAKGGLLYDKWWKAADGATEPEDDHPLWALQDSNTRSGADTWRCKECHGWDYKGKGGAYSSGSHYTGFPGVYDAATTKSKAQILDALKGGTDYRHDFSSVLSDEAMEDLANFLKEGVINDTLYIDYAAKKPIGGDATSGKELYEKNCAACHGADGKQILFGGKETLGEVAAGNPWETLHKIRAGQPGAGMPSGITTGWSLQDMLDILAYAQTLPPE